MLLAFKLGGKDLIFLNHIKFITMINQLFLDSHHLPFPLIVVVVLVLLPSLLTSLRSLMDSSFLRLP